MTTTLGRRNTEGTSFTNTATILLPRIELSKVPFDLLLMSNVYVWFYALAARMGILRTLRSDIYPTNLAYLPWNDQVANRAEEIEGMRNTIVASCTSCLHAAESLRETLEALVLNSLKECVRGDPEARISWGDNFLDPKYATTIGEVSVIAVEDGWQVRWSSDLFDSIECNREPFAKGIAIALEQRTGNELDKSLILNLPVPVSPDEVIAWKNVVTDHQTKTLEQSMAGVISALDQIVGDCLGLSGEDITEIQRDLVSDPFLKGIRPRYPGTVTRKQGFRTGLDSEERYG